MAGVSVTEAAAGASTSHTSSSSLRWFVLLFPIALWGCGGVGTDGSGGGSTVGGGLARADGRDLSYFLWAIDLRFALTSWLAIGVADLGLRAGPEPSGGNHVAFAVTPLLELSHWSGIGYPHRGNVMHLDLGLTTEHVFGGKPNPHPYAVEAAIGYRIFASDVAEPDIMAGLTVALKDGFVVDDRVSAGSVMPFIRFSFGWRP